MNSILKHGSNVGNNTIEDILKKNNAKKEF